jgi:hypothetical protein
VHVKGWAAEARAAIKVACAMTRRIAAVTGSRSDYG